MTRVTLDGLVKRYGKVAALDGASFEVRPGELAYVLGPAGAGKSTLARVVAGLETLDGGEIFFNERVVHKLPAVERKVGLVFEGDALWPRLTVAENVAFPLKLQRVARPQRQARTAEALTLLRIDSLAGRRPEALTPLQRQRAALARALVTDPELLILDEPFARLEPRARDELREEIVRLHGESETTTLVLTRDPREALAVAHRLGVLDLGRVLQSGTPADVYNRPADAFVARLLGATNLVQGQVEGTDPRGEVVVRTPLGRLVGQAPSGPLAAGTPVTVVIRPEALALGAVTPGANRFPATVERLTFLGDTRQVHLRGPGDWPVMSLTLQCQSQALREGQGVTLSVAPEFVVVIAGKYALAQ
jgi:ABC-type Fe3+/spermidine/putrescine transport system ATPase subunit